MATVEQVNAAIGQLARLVPGDWPPIGSFDELREKYGIDYRAPGDARATQLPDNTAHLVYSSATLEHIPPAELRAILRECKRILQPGGRMCFTIDYHDHYASSDKSIGYMNFYRFSEEEWRRYNPGTHYQNRLRHSDYVRLFEEEGLALLENRRIYDTWSETDLERVRIHADFERYSRDDLVTSNGFFVLADAQEAAVCTAVAATA